MANSTTAKFDRRKRQLHATSALAVAEPLPGGRVGHKGGAPVQVEPLAVRPRVAWRLLDCGNTHGYELINAGELESYLDGRSRRITMRSIKALIARRLADNPTTAEPTAPQPRRRGRPRKRGDTVLAP